MMKGLTLKELATTLKNDLTSKKDYVAPTKKIAMHVRDGEKGARFPILEMFGVDHEYPMTGLAHDQVGARLGIPAAYYDRMLAEKPDLLAHNVNAWFAAKDELRMVRTLHGRARAFLSDRYQPIDNYEVANVVLPILSKIPDVKVVSCEVTERRMYIQAVSPRTQGEVKRGDVVQAGVVISNSEVGAGSVSAAAMDYRLVCLNGMISAERFRAFHTGRRREEGDVIDWSDDTRRAEDSAVLHKVRDMVNAAVDATRFKARIDRMKGLAGIEVSGDPVKVVELVAKRVGATDEERGGILESLIKGKDLSAWGVLNAVTHQAHKARSYDRAVEFEAAGGQLLELSKREWTSILEPAA